MRRTTTEAQKTEQRKQALSWKAKAAGLGGVSVPLVVLGDDVFFEPGFRALRDKGELVHLSRAEGVILNRLANSEPRIGERVHFSEIPELVDRVPVGEATGSAIHSGIRRNVPGLQKKLKEAGITLEYDSGWLRLVE